jgi:antitoxin CptB
MAAKIAGPGRFGKADKRLLPVYRNAELHLRERKASTIMTGTTRSSAEIDPRRKRILFRCWHRGIREMDLVLGGFADAEIDALSEAELDELERIMAEEDNDLIKWVTGEKPVPDAFRDGLFPRIAAYRPDFSPLFKDDRA